MDDIFIQELEEKFGDTGYAFWFKTLELIASQGSEGVLVIPLTQYRRVIHSHRTDHLRRLYTFATERGRLVVTELTDNRLRIECANFAKYADNYTKYGRHLQSDFKVSSKQEEEQNRIEKKNPPTPQYMILSLPEKLVAIPAFQQAWQDWQDYRREIKKRLTPRSAESQLKFLASQPDPVAVIELAIRNQWQGLFKIKDTDNVKGSGTQFSRATYKHSPEDVPRYNRFVDGLREVHDRKRRGGSDQ